MQKSCETTGQKEKDQMKKFSEWLIIILIVVFFAIPVCSLAVCESVTRWPNCSTYFVYNLLFK